MSFALRNGAPPDAKPIYHSNQTRDLRTGDIVSVFGESLFDWDDYCVTEDLSQMYVYRSLLFLSLTRRGWRWRRQGDPLCDEALQAVFPSSSSSVGKDLLASVEQFASDHPECLTVQAFLNEVIQLPPSDVKVHPDDVVLAQQVFLDNSIEIVQALLHFSLAGGFAR